MAAKVIRDKRLEEDENENYYFLWWSESGTSLIIASVSPTKITRSHGPITLWMWMFSTSARVLSYRWVLHYFSPIQVGRIKIVTIYKRSILQVEWLIATLILCISHCSKSDSVSSRVFYSAVSTAPRFLFFLVLSVTWPRPLLGQVLVGTLNHATCNVYSPKAFETSIHENVTHIVFFIVCEKYFLLVLSKCSIRSKKTCYNVQGLHHW